MAEPRFLDFLDRIDGGGMGQSGDTFKDGGLLSMLGNLFASPYGAKNPERRARRDAFYAGSPMAASGFNPTSVQTVNEKSANSPRQYSERGSYGPPARALVGPNLIEAMWPQRTSLGLRQAQPAAVTRPDALTTGQQPSAFEALSPARDLRDMQQSANYAPTTGTQADLFLASLRSQHGPEKAYAIAKSPFARDLFSYYLNNNYTLPAM